MTNRVGGQLVNGQDNVLGPGFGQACLAGMSLNSCSQCGKRVRIERQVQNGYAWFACRVVIGHAVAFPPVGFGQIGTRAAAHLRIRNRAASRRTIDTHPLPAVRAGKPAAATIIDRGERHEHLHAGASGRKPGEQVWPGGWG
jgi:hypothetical protein